MKQTVKLLLGLFAGMILGLSGAIIGISLMEGKPISEVATTLLSANLLDAISAILMAIVFMIISVFLQIILHEAGHLVCGLASGYRFVSFRILSFTFIRQNNAIRIKKFSIAGTGGQCLLTPPEKPLDQISTTWYNLGGVLANFLTAALAIILLITLNTTTPLEIFLILFSFVGIFFGLLNGIPRCVSGIGNDAYNIGLLKKDPKSKQALITQLKVNALMQEGVRLKEMPKEWFYPYEIDYKNALQVTIGIIGIGRMMDLEEWDASYKAMEEVVAHKNEMMGLLAKEAICELVFLALITGNNQRAAELYTPEIKTYIEQYKNISSSKQRILFAIALYLEKEPSKATEIYNTLCQQKDKYLMQGEVKMDLALMESITTHYSTESH